MYRALASRLELCSCFRSCRVPEFSSGVSLDRDEKSFKPWSSAAEQHF